MGVDILGIDIPAPTRTYYLNHMYISVEKERFTIIMRKNMNFFSLLNFLMVSCICVEYQTFCLCLS